jgi:hypothetical protein
VKGTDADDPAVSDENKKISKMVIEFAQRPGENPSPWSVDFKKPLNLLDVV